MPQQVFKRERLYAAGLPEPGAVYETSGTTTGEPGRQLLWRRRHLPRGRGRGRAPRRALQWRAGAPLPRARAGRCAAFVALRDVRLLAKGRAPDRRRFWATRDGFDFTALRETLLDAIKAGKKIGLSGTAFAFVHLLDAWAGLPPLRLPRGSWLLETGGFKGRSREVSKPELYAALAENVPCARRRDLERVRHERALQPGLRARHARSAPDAAVGARPRGRSGHRPRSARGAARPRALDRPREYRLCPGAADARPRRAHRGRLPAPRAGLPRTEPRGCSLGAEDLVAVGSRRSPSDGPPLGQRRLPRDAAARGTGRRLTSRKR